MNSSLPSQQTTSSGQEASTVMGGRLHQPSPFVLPVMIFIIIIHFITFPFTAVLNALVMLAVKLKPRLRAHKSNILLALFASTDFVVGVAIQPVFIALIITFVLGKAPSAASLLQAFTGVATSCLVDVSLLHLAFISGERYLAMKHSFAYVTLVTEPRLLAASAFGWLLPVVLHIPIAFQRQIVFVLLQTTFTGLSIAFIIFCHVTVYREIRRHEQQLAAQQVTHEAREQFENNRKALKLISIILAVILLCYIPGVILRIVLLRYHSEMSLETARMCFSLGASLALWNSFLNPIIYSIRMRQFRVAFIELMCRNVNIAEAEEIEMRVFGAPNAVVRLEEEQQQERQHQETV